MSKWFKFGIVGMLAVGAIAVLVTGVALAQDGTTQTPATPQTQTQPWGPGAGRDTVHQAGEQAAADALGMTVDEMNTQLWGGKTLADLAEEKGVALTDVQAAVQTAVQAAQKDAFRTAIDQAVAAGTITQENANWLIEGLDKGYIPGFGMGGMHGGFGGGFGEGFGGRGHHGGFGGPGMFGTPPSDVPQTNPSTSPSGTSSGGA